MIVAKGFDSPKKVACWIMAIAVIVVCYFLTLDRYAPSAHDATVQANVLALSSPVGGVVEKMYVSVNQFVKKGEPLFSVAPYSSPVASIHAHAKIVRAPIDVYVSEIKQPALHTVAAYEPVLTLIDATHWWITATLKENNLERVKPGDKVLISVNTRPGVIAQGHVSSVGFGALASVPISNANLPVITKTTNWISLAQRFPVVIEFDDLNAFAPLRLGSTAIVTVYTNDDPVIHGLAYFAQWVSAKSQVFY